VSQTSGSRIHLACAKRLCLTGPPGQGDCQTGEDSEGTEQFMSSDCGFGNEVCAYLKR
jgi:hypothetical protein